MGRIAAKNVAVAIIALLPLLAIDYLSVRSGLGKNSGWSSTWITVPALLVAPLGFFWANWALLGPNPRIKHFAEVAVLAIVVSVVWLFVAFTVVGNFHLAIGGRL